MREPTRTRGGGIGWGLPASVGVSLANPQRPVVCYSGDGSSMYSIQSLWTAANHKLPLNFVIVTAAVVSIGASRPSTSGLRRPTQPLFLPPEVHNESTHPLAVVK